MSQAEFPHDVDPALAPQPGPSNAAPTWVVVTGLIGFLIPILMLFLGPASLRTVMLVFTQDALPYLAILFCAALWPLAAARLRSIRVDDAGIRIDRRLRKQYEPFAGLRSVFVGVRGDHPWLLAFRHDGRRVLQMPLISDAQKREAQRAVTAFRIHGAARRHPVAVDPALSRQGQSLQAWAARLDAWDASATAYRRAPTDSKSLALTCESAESVEHRAAAAYLLAKRADPKLAALLHERTPALVTALAWAGQPGAVDTSALRACLPYLSEPDRAWLEDSARSPRLRVADAPTPAPEYVPADAPDPSAEPDPARSARA